MNIFSVLLACVAITFGSAIVTAQDEDRDTFTLKSLVDSFNENAAKHAVGMEQPPLTEAEVVAAIRAWVPESTPDVTDDIYARFQKIAETEKLAEGSSLDFTSGWTGYRGFRFDVWWIDLSISTGEGTGYTFRIRDRKISSRKMTPEELAEWR